MGSARDGLALDSLARPDVTAWRGSVGGGIVGDDMLSQLGLVMVLAVAAAIRVSGLHFSLWLDETASLAFAREPLSHLWGEWMVRETNPPLFYTLLKGWRAIAGTLDAVARLLPVAIGLVGVWGMFVLGRAVGGARAGLFAAALVAVSPIHVDYSLQLRGYGLAWTGVVFACLGMVRVLQDQRRRWLALYVAGTAMALYGHTTLVLFGLLANGAMLSLLRRDRLALGQWLAANVLLGMIWSWWGWMTIRQLSQPHNFGWIGTPTPADAWDMTRIALVPLYLRSATLGGGVILLAMVGGVIAFAVKARRPETTLLAILAVGAPVLLFAVSQKTPIFLPRTLFWAAVPLTALLAAAVVSLAERRLALLLASALLLLSAAGTAAWFSDGEQEHWDAVARTIDLEAGDRPILVTDDAVALSLVHYLPRAEQRVVVVDDPRQSHERWSTGLFEGRHLTPVEVTTWFRDRCHVVGVSRGDYDPTAMLKAAGGRPTVIGQRERNPIAALWDCEARRGVR